MSIKIKNESGFNLTENLKHIISAKSAEFSVNQVVIEEAHEEGSEPGFYLPVYDDSGEFLFNVHLEKEIIE